MAKYVIRGYHWGYNDETYYPAGSYIHSIFDDKEQAKARLHALERAHWQEMDLGETDTFFDGDESLCKKLNDFVYEKCGKKVFDDCDDTRDCFIPDELSDEDFMSALKLTGLQAYKLTAFEDAPKFHAIWFPKEEEYLMIYDECTTALLYEDSLQALAQEAEEHLGYRWDGGTLKFKGSHAELSDTPTALEQVIKTTKGLKYDDKNGELKIDTSNPNALFLVSELLKEPPLVIKTLDLEQIRELEEEYGEEC